MRRDLVKMKSYMEDALKLLETCAEKTKAKEKVDVEALKAQQTKGFAKMKGMFSKKKTVTPTAESNHVDDRAVYLLTRGSILREMDRADEAMDLFREVISFDGVLTD